MNAAGISPRSSLPNEGRLGRGPGATGTPDQLIVEEVAVVSFSWAQHSLLPEQPSLPPEAAQKSG